MPGLAVHTADVDHAAEFTLAHTLKRQLAKIVAGAQVRIEDGVPHVAPHPQQRAIAGYAGVVHQDFDRPEISNDLGNTGFAFFEAGDVEFRDRDVVFLGKRGGGFIV